MAVQFLEPEQRRQLEAILKDDQNENLRRRAQALLLYDEGQPTREVARAVGRSRGRTRYWRRQFNVHGMKIFNLPEPEEGPLQGGAGQPHEGGERPAPVETPIDARPAPLAAEAREPVTPQAGGPDAEEAAEADELYELWKGMKSPGVQPDDPLAEAGRKVIRYHFAQMLRHEAGTRLGEDIEALHDMRVATRRMRAAFEVFSPAFKPKALKTHLKRLRATGRALGRVRDLDVFMEKAGRYLESLPESQRQGLEPLLDGWRREREAARAQMVAYLDSKDYQVFKRAFYTFLSTPGAGALASPQGAPAPDRVREIAPVLVYSRLAAVRAYENVLSGASIEQLHALRIEFKKLRYTVEFFREVLGEEAKAVINDIKGLQDHLGDLNDAEVAIQILNQFLAGWDAQQAGLPLSERQNPEPVVAYLAYQHAERHRLVTSFHQAWDCFDRPEFRRSLALAISVL